MSVVIENPQTSVQTDWHKVAIQTTDEQHGKSEVLLKQDSILAEISGWILDPRQQNLSAERRD